MTAPVVFSHAWFHHHQRRFLALLNAPILGHEVRAACGVHRSDVGAEAWPIVAWYPSYYIVGYPDGTYVADFRTHPKYAQVLRSRFDLIWRAMHTWDRYLAEPFCPRWDLGFNTLTVFPDPSPGVTSCDGVVSRTLVSESWSTIQAGAGNLHNDTATNSAVVTSSAAATTDQWALLGRGIFLFDTSALGASATLVAAVLSLFGTTKVDSLGVSPSIDVYTSSPASNTVLANADYSQVGSVSQTGAPISYASYATSAYNDFPLNATGLTAVSLTSVSKFGVRNPEYDVANVSPTWSNSNFYQLNARMADQAGTTQDPKLTVTFGPNWLLPVIPV